MVHVSSSQASERPGSFEHLRKVRLLPLAVAMAAVSAVRASSFRPSINHDRPARSNRADGLMRSQPNKSSGLQPSASARSAHPSSRNRPQSSIKPSHRFGETSQGAQAGSSRASASAQRREAPPSYSATAARSSSASPHSEYFIEVTRGSALATLATLAGPTSNLRLWSW